MGELGKLSLAEEVTSIQGEAPKNYATPKQVRKLAKTMNSDFLRCRRLGHVWEPISAIKVNGGFEEQVKCDRCGAEKDRLYSNRGHLTGTARFQYPEGYVFVGVGRVTGAARDAVTLLSLTSEIKSKGSRK